MPLVVLVATPTLPPVDGKAVPLAALIARLMMLAPPTLKLVPNKPTAPSPFLPSAP